MPRFSAFTRFGHLAFSGRSPVGLRLFQSMRAALGGDENLATDFDGSHVNATIYARAMALACAQLTLERANANRRPTRSTEAISAHERDYGIVLPVSGTLDERRAALRVAQQLPRGATEENVRTLLDALLGDRLVAIRYLKDGEFIASPYVPHYWHEEAAPGTWLPSDTVQKWRTTDSDFVAGSATVATTYRAGATDLFQVGERLVIDPDVLGLAESFTVTGTTGSTITATFTRGHAAGALITSAPWPCAISTARYVLVVVTEATATSETWRARIGDLLRRTLRAVDVWAVVSETSPGELGPFKVGVGMIGITPIGTLQTIP